MQKIVLFGKFVLFVIALVIVDIWIIPSGIHHNGNKHDNS